MGLLSPSILSSDFSDLKEQIRILEVGGADWIHCDVMDGLFVPNLTFGPIVIGGLNKITNLPLDVHLMIVNPDKYLNDYYNAGADILTVHQEAVIHLHRTISSIQELGLKAGVSINPATPVKMIESVLENVDLVLVMSVNPGFGGQKFIPYSLKKIEQLKEIKIKHNYDFLIEVDGGIGLDNIEDVLNAGAEIIVAGASIFKSTNPIQTTQELKSIIINRQKETKLK